MDFGYLNAISDGDQDFIEEFVTTFEENNAKIISEMESSFNSQNFDQLGKLAHQLKPSIEMLGLEECLETIVRLNSDPQTSTQADLDFIKKTSDDSLLALKAEYNL